MLNILRNKIKDIENTLQLMFIIMAVILSSCINENPNLLNPPPQSEFVTLRFVNLGADKQSRSLSLDQNKVTTEVGYALSSEAVHPTLDSSYAGTMIGGSIDYKSPYKTHFFRNTNYTFIGVPSANSATISRNLDTMIVLSSVIGLNVLTNSAYIKVVNCIPDTTFMFNVMLGCPNGAPLAQNLMFRGQSIPVLINAGMIAVSVLKLYGTNQDIIGLYQLNLNANGQYTLIIYQKTPGSIDFLLLDEENNTNSAINPASVVQISDQNKTSQVRSINFSTQTINVTKQPNIPISSNLAPGMIDMYENIQACGSETQDSIVIYSGSSTLSGAVTSLEVLKKFTIMVFDSANRQSGTCLIASPVHLQKPLNGKALIRVVNGAYNPQNLTISVAARTDATEGRGFRAGELLASKLAYGTISDYYDIEATNIPVTVFTTDEPTRLLANSILNLEAEKQYLLVIRNNPIVTDSIECFLIEDNDENKTISPIEQSAFTQIVHLLPGASTINLTVPPVLSNATIYTSGFIATLMPQGNQTVKVNNSSLQINSNNSLRNLIIIAGDAANPDINLLQYPPFNVQVGSYQRRFINACKEVNQISVALNCDTCYIQSAIGIAYGGVSQPEIVNLERNSSFTFVNANTKEVLKRVDDIFLSYGKNYSIIFGGNSVEGYTAVVLQEF